MKQRTSPIMEEFFRLVAEKDNNYSSFEAADKAIKKIDKTRRSGSLSVEDIAKLYNVKPDLPKDNQYENNIMEDAHPDSQVLCPAYDKINGLVENNIERQNIILNIVNKHNNGNHTQHKYAQKDLIMSLVRVGNDLDNKDKDNLRILADTCLFQIAKPIKKEAWLQLAGGIAVGVAAILGTLYAQQHLPMINDGLKKDSQTLISELNDLVNSNSSWGVGYDLSESVKTIAQDAINRITKFMGIYEQVEPIILNVSKPKGAKELIIAAKQPGIEAYSNAYKKLWAEAIELQPFLKQIKDNFSNETYKKMQIKDKGFLSSLVDRTMLHGGSGLIADDFGDVSRAIPPFLNGITQMLNILKQGSNIAAQAKKQIEEATSELGGITEEQPEQQPEQQTQTVKPEESALSMDSIGDSLKGLMKNINPLSK